MIIRMLIYSIIRVLDVLSIAIVVYAVMSWFARGTSVYAWMARILEPILEPFRRLSRAIMSRTSIPIDFSCWFAILAIRIVTNILSRLYYLF